MSEEKQNITDMMKNEEFKKKIINGLGKLGFPLEFKIRRQLKDSGYKSVQEGFFTVFSCNQIRIIQP